MQIVNPYLGSNASFDEIVKYGTDAQLRAALEEREDGKGRAEAEVKELERRIELLERRIELLEEQLYFAEEVAAKVLRACERETRAKELKQAILSAFDESMWER